MSLYWHVTNSRTRKTNFGLATSVTIVSIIVAVYLSSQPMIVTCTQRNAFQEIVSNKLRVLVITDTLCPDVDRRVVLTADCLKLGGNVCTFECIQGYKHATTDTSIECEIGGEWNISTASLCKGSKYFFKYMYIKSLH